MKAPTRVRDDSSARDDVRAMLRSARCPEAIPQRARVRSRARVATMIALPVATSAWLSTKAGVALAAILCAAGAAGVHALASRRSDTKPPGAEAGATHSSAREAAAAPASPTESERALAPADEPAAVDRVADAPTASAPSAPERNVTEPKRKRGVDAPRAGANASSPGDGRAITDEPAAPLATASASEDPLARETALLDDARLVLATSPSEALLRLEKHAVMFPRGKLGHERELLTIDALRRMGRYAEARARGEALLARSSQGLYAERVRRMLATMP